MGLSFIFDHALEQLSTNTRARCKKQALLWLIPHLKVGMGKKFISQEPTLVFYHSEGQHFFIWWLATQGISNLLLKRYFCYMQLICCGCVGPSLSSAALRINQWLLWMQMRSERSQVKGMTICSQLDNYTLFQNKLKPEPTVAHCFHKSCLYREINWKVHWLEGLLNSSMEFISPLFHGSFQTAYQTEPLTSAQTRREIKGNINNLY